MMVPTECAVSVVWQGRPRCMVEGEKLLASWMKLSYVL